MKRPLIVANWKSHKTAAQAQSWVSEFKNGSVQSTATVVVCPPAALLQVCAHPDHSWHLGAQDVSPYPAGSYTGAVCAETYASCSVSFCIVGHSERRQHFSETSSQVASKVRELLAHAITPIVCVDTPYLDEQLAMLDPHELKQCVIAFEPLSAIGTGQRADVGLVAAVKAQVQKHSSVAAFIYGGSVSAESIAEYLLVCDGALVGGASLETDSFLSLLAAATASLDSEK